jgi:hypothetical protein
MVGNGLIHLTMHFIEQDGSNGNDSCKIWGSHGGDYEGTWSHLLLRIIRNGIGETYDERMWYLRSCEDCCVLG